MDFWTPVSASRIEEASRSVVVGKTKRIRLPSSMYFTLNTARPEDICVFVSDEWEMPHEIIVFEKPSVIEDEEHFEIGFAMKNTSCSLCYFDFELCQFMWIDSNNGIFFKKDKYVRHGVSTSHLNCDELALLFSVKSITHENKSYDMPVIYKRDEKKIDYRCLSASD